MVPLTDPEEALIKVPPKAKLVASPEVVIVATPVTEELQTTEFVRSCGLPLVKTPVAVNCKVLPSWTEGLAGVKKRANNSGVVTVRRADPLRPPDSALIVVTPCAALTDNPNCVTIATDGEEELQTAELLRSCVAPSLNVPTALNCCRRPRGIDELKGEIAIEDRTRGVTVRTAEPLRRPTAALIVATPCAAPTAKPELVTVATPGREELHVAKLVMSRVMPSA